MTKPVRFPAGARETYLIAALALSFTASCTSNSGETTPRTGGHSTAGTGGVAQTGGTAGANSTSGGALGTGGISSTGGAPSTGGLPTTGGVVASGGFSSTTGGIGASGGASGGSSGAGGGRSDGATSDATDGAIDVSASDSGNRGAGGQAGIGGATGGSAGQPAMTIWIAGDSTVMTYDAGNTEGTNGTSLEGWGQELGQFFSSKVTISNQAIGGRSVAFFMWSVARDSAGAYACVDNQGTPKFQTDAAGNRTDSSQWSRIKSGIKAGDFLMVQFGHNDETHTCPRYVSISDYQLDLGIMADTAVAKGATVIFVTPMGHRTFSGTAFNNTLLPYANAMKDAASKKKIEVADLNLRSGEYYESVGNAYLASTIFDGGTTHFVKAGALKMAELIVGEIKKNKGPLAAYLK